MTEFVMTQHEDELQAPKGTGGLVAPRPASDLIVGIGTLMARLAPEDKSA
jgi:hypothetical protein